MAKNKITCLEAEVIFEGVDGYKISVHPFHVYTVFGTDTVTFKLIALPKESGLCILTSKAKDLEVDGVTYTMEELPSVLQDKFAESGAQMRGEVVDELPASGRTNTIYLVPRTTPEGETVYDEYIWLKDEQRWELIGDTSIEMYRYLKKDDFAIYSALTEDKIDFLSGAVDDLSDELDGLSGETMIISGNVDELLSDVATLSGETMTISGDLLSHVADMVAHITAQERTSWNAKADEADLIELSGNILSQVDVLSGKVDENEQVTSASLNDLDLRLLGLDGAVVELEGDSDDLWDAINELANDMDDKADVSALTAYTTATEVNDLIDNAVSGKADTSALTAYSTTVEVNTLIDRAVSGKQDTLSAGTGIGITDNVISVTGGGGGTIDSSLSANSPNAVANSAITAGIDAKANKSAVFGSYSYGATSNVDFIRFKDANNSNKGNEIYYPKINNKGILTSNYQWASANYNFQLLETSALTTTLDSSSTDSQVPSAKAVFDALQSGGITSGEVQTMIDESVSGKADSQDVSTLSGQVQDMDMVVAIALNTLNQEVSGKADTSALTEYTTASEVNTLINGAVSGKADSQDVNTLSGQVQTMDRVVAISLNQINTDLGGVKFVLISQSDYDNLPVKDSHTLYIINDVQ